jgi:hypothetical protein
MNSAVRTISIDRTSPRRISRAMRHLAGGVSVITAGRASDITGMMVTSVVAVGRSAEPDRQHQPGIIVLAGIETLRSSA